MITLTSFTLHICQYKFYVISIMRYQFYTDYNNEFKLERPIPAKPFMQITYLFSYVAPLISSRREEETNKQTKMFIFFVLDWITRLYKIIRKVGN